IRLGVFDPPEQNPYAAIPPGVINSPEHVALAREAAAKSVVLLKNDGLGNQRLLPLRKPLKTIAVIGPTADNEEVLLGNYNGTPAHAVTVLEGLQARLEPRVDVRHSHGCGLAEGWPNLYPVPARALSAASSADPGRGLGGLAGAYFASPRFAGGPFLLRVDPELNFIWREERPLPYLGPRVFSVRWTGALVPPLTGRYRLGFRGCGRFTVWLDGQPVIRGDNPHHPMLSVYDVHLQAGRRYDLRIDYVSGIHQAHAQFLWATPGQAQVERETALACAADADLIIACMGLSPALEGEEMAVSTSGFDRGDRTRIELPQPQQELLELLYGLQKPVVLVLLTGSALAIPWAAEKLPAILVGWYGGEQAGNAIADVLFGDVNPAGRLPVTFYRSTEDLPPFEDYAMASPTGGRTYRYFQGRPLYPFGHGLSYTRFGYGNLRVEPETIAPDGEATVSVDITNTGAVAGDEVVQLYVRYPNSAVLRPREELKGFARVHLAPGDMSTVRFALPARQLAYWDSGWQVESVPVQLAVGASSGDLRLSTTLNIARSQ
ncbi:MAG: glycoside hydrolase family 3 C-terminal domain-containing protein, partial [Nitrososphaerales archaeon]